MDETSGGRTATLRIRKATEADEALLVMAAVALARETEGKQLAPEVVLAGVRGVLENPQRGFYLVAEREGEAAASLMVTKEWSDWRNGNFWWIQSVYVQPPHRRRGVFRELYDALRRVARAKANVCGLRLYVHHENEAARRTYDACGMQRAHYELFEDEFA